MVLLTVRNVEINFPFEPYHCQVDYMEKVIQCLQEGTNGVLESPTGTGKTLCLLCATLAWRETFVAHLQLNMKIQDTKVTGEFCENLQEGLGHAATGWLSEENKQNSRHDVPKIIYTSRTHSQLSQAVSELKSTVYTPKVCVLGSRDQMCIHPGVMKQESHTAKVHMCRSKISSKSCHFYNSLDAKQSEKDFSEKILDIEDLVALGTKHSVCPYYLSRTQKNSADIVFMPYNYLIDAKSRSGNNIDISNSIIIFDEAHNLESLCENAVSFDLTSFDIASCIEDLDSCLDTVTKMEEDGTFSLDDESAEGCDIDKKEVAYMKGIFLNFEEELHKIASSSPPKGTTKPGNFIFELLNKVKITNETQNQVVEMLDKCNNFLVANSSSIKAKQYALTKFSDALKIVFKTGAPSTFQDANGDLSKYYKVHIEAKNDTFSKKSLDVWSSSSAVKNNKGYSLGYWCFSPGETMKDLVRSGIRSIILTSGTLSPLQSFTAELQIEIPVQLQNPHVIKHHQMCVGILKSGPDGTALNSSFQNRTNPKYLTSLGSTLANFARTVPDGLLVFFPSYTVLNSSVKYWQDKGIWNRITQMKEIFVEPRTKVEFVEVMEGFYEKIRDPNTKGAIFLAVCRGKVSEGLDFADMNGRAVVITGLPYPPFHDAKVSLKMSFLDEVKDKRTFKGLTGRDWYQQQASRAVNQAVGRVLRHKDDYGAIILCDERFIYGRNVSELPRWVQPYIKKFSNFGEVQSHLTQFFRRADKLSDKSCIKQKQKPQPKTETQLQKPPSLKENKNQTGLLEALRRNQILINQAAMRRDVENETPLAIQYENNTNYETSKKSDKATKSKGVFDSLEAFEKKSNDNPQRESFKYTEKTLQEMQPCSSCPTQEPSCSRTAVKKKLKIVRSKHPKEEEVKCSSHDTEVPGSDEKLASAKIYFQKVKCSLDQHHLGDFSKTLREYKKNNDIDSLLRALTVLFLSESKYYDLYLGFSSYIKPAEDKELFFQNYKDITGEEIPDVFEKRKREKQADTATAIKKARTDC